MTRQNNLLFVFPDQLGAAWLGCYGNTDVQTPHINQFAQEALLFERAYTCIPLCTPYRASLFTGRYAFQTGVTENNLRIPAGEITLPELLNQAGYFTSYVGKWHLSGDGAATKFGSGLRWIPPELRHGFQQFIGWESGHVDHWKGLIWENDPDHAIEMPGHETDALTDIACQRLEELRDQPFCLFVAYQAPHPPCSAPREYYDIYHGKPRSPRLNMGKAGKPYKVTAWGYKVDQMAFQDDYFGEISHFDAAFGRLLARLDELGLAENTTVVLTSDHGEMAGCHDLFGKSVMYDESVHVPLIVRHPRGTRAMRTPSLISTVDLGPTLLDLCGAQNPTSFGGISYAQLIQGIPQAERECAFIEYFKDEGLEPSQSHSQVCVVSGQYKLVANPDGFIPVEFFDLVNDPYEINNLVTHSEKQGLITDLRDELVAWREKGKKR